MPDVLDTTRAVIEIAGIPGYSEKFTSISEPGGSQQSVRYVEGDGSVGYMSGNVVFDEITVTKPEKPTDAPLINWLKKPTYPKGIVGVTVTVTYYDATNRLNIATTKVFKGCTPSSFKHSGADLNPELPAYGMISITFKPADSKTGN